MLYRITFLLVLNCLFIVNFLTGQNIALVPFATGFDRPVDISVAPGESYLYITEQDGYIYKVDQNGTTLPNVFLDIEARVNSGGNERGLLGLVFHPNYATNGYFYVNYTATGGGATKISRFSVNPANPDLALPNSEFNIMSIPQPYSNHNAGDLEFGPDGYLYIPLGDGGSGGDPGNRSQNPQELLGKMLRIDVDNGTPYSIPADNPFINNPSVLDEIWAIGLRNPWRISFDRLNGDLYIADVGQDDYEEIDVQPASSLGGENYGWRCYEGNSAFNTNGCGPASNYVFPVHEYINSFSVGCSVTGGYVYRGTQFPSLYGQYFYADFCTGRFWSLEQAGGVWTNTNRGTFISQNYSTFGEDENGELYVGGLSDGIIYQVTDPVCQSFMLTNIILVNSNCENDNSGSIDVTVNTSSPYTLTWSTGATTDDISNLAPGFYTVTATNTDGCMLNSGIQVGFDNTPIVPTISFLGPQSLESTTATTYQWYVNATILAGETNQTVPFTQNGDYTVVTTDANGCLATSQPFSVMVNIDDPNWLNQFTVQPNPFSSEVEVNWATDQSEALQLELLNTVGQVIYQSTVEGSGSILLPTETLAAGIYFLRLGTKEASTVRKLAKH